ncbi:MAG: DUF134 domain-containing protein [Methanobacterium sp.]|jgi:predicted DNA-binding protein (UPF0251 family)
MVRPRRFRRIFQEPEIRCFKPDSEGNIDSIKPVDITIDEFEAIRLKDYQNIKQKKAAEIMDVSQPTFHRTLNSAREKIAKALVEGKIIKIKGGDFVADKERYKCKSCGFEWYSPEKEYDECPDCKSEYIYKIGEGEETQRPAGQQGIGRRRGYGGVGIGAGPPRVCKCPNCGYESPKTPGVPCRNTKCPECGTQLCGAD